MIHESSNKMKGSFRLTYDEDFPLKYFPKYAFDIKLSRKLNDRFFLLQTCLCRVYVFYGSMRCSQNCGC